MITANITGNLGNWISQMAITKVLADMKGFEFGFDPPTNKYTNNGLDQMYFMNVDMGRPVEGIVNTFEEKWDFFRGVNVTTFDKRVYDIADNTRLIGYNGAAGGLYQSEEYYKDHRDKLMKWFAVKLEYAAKYEQILINKGITLDDNTCVINFRGGEYRGIPEVLLNKKYWHEAVRYMQCKNKNMNFVCITDDVELAAQYMPEEVPYPIHIDIGFDYYVVNNAKWLIISNSSFGYWAAWLNEEVKMTIAPKYWAHFNISDAYWALGDQYNSRFIYMDRIGDLWTYDECKSEALLFYKTNKILPQLYENL